MKWEGNRESEHVEDRRGGFGGGRSIGIGTVVIAVAASLLFGVNPLTVLGLLGGDGAPQATAPADDRMTRFVSTVLADTEDVWTELFRSGGAGYEKPTLVLFTGSTPTACGTGSSASGPFYCPADRKIYIDLAFYRLMQQRYQVAGEFAQAYVIAHEVGHHVQTLMGISGKVDEARRRVPQSQANRLSVQLELQADCFAGVWAHHANRTRGILEAGDVEAGLNAASAIGDDALQRKEQGHVVPDSFTHGTSAQRVRWFRRGIDSGKVGACNTFETRDL